MLHPRTSLSLVAASGWSAAEGLEAARAIGAASVSFSASQFALEPRGCELVRGADLEVVSVGTGGIGLIDSPEQSAERLEPLLALAGDLLAGTAFMVVGPTPPRMPTDEALAKLCECLPLSVARAQANGVQLAIENNGQATRQLGFLQSLGDAFLVCRETGAKLVLELQNCWYEGQLKAQFRRQAEHIALVQVSDFRLGETLAFNRWVPGDGDIPLEWLMGSLLEAGYGGLFELEILGPAIAGEGYASAMGRGCEWISERLIAWGA